MKCDNKDYERRFRDSLKEARKEVSDKKNRNDNSWMVWIHQNSLYIIVTIVLSTVFTAYTVSGFSELIPQDIVNILIQILGLLTLALPSLVLLIMLIGNAILSSKESTSHNWWLFTEYLCEKYGANGMTDLEAGVNSRIKSYRTYRRYSIGSIGLIPLAANFENILISDPEKRSIRIFFTALANDIGIDPVKLFIGAFFGILIVYFLRVEVPLQ